MVNLEFFNNIEKLFNLEGGPWAKVSFDLAS